MRPLVYCWALSASNLAIFLRPLTLNHLTLIHTNIDININIIEDFNQLSLEQIDLLKRLKEAISDITPHF
jgi:hypothetical protein